MKNRIMLLPEQSLYPVLNFQWPRDYIPATGSTTRSEASPLGDKSPEINFLTHIFFSIPTLSQVA